MGYWRNSNVPWCKTFEAGDHTVLIGEVRQAEYVEGKPLVFFNSAYQSLVDDE